MNAEPVNELSVRIAPVAARHIAGFAVSGPVFRVSEPNSRAPATVEPAFIGVTWTSDNGDDWRLLKVDATGPRLLKNGVLGKDLTITVFDLVQFPSEIAKQIEARGPDGDAGGSTP